MRTTRKCIVVLLCLVAFLVAPAALGASFRPGQAPPCVPDDTGQCTVPHVSMSVSVNGGTVTVYWVSSNSDRCEALGSWGGDLALQGQSSVAFPPGTYTLIVRCYGQGTYAQMGADVVIGGGAGGGGGGSSPPVVTLSVNPDFVNNGGTVRVSWTSTNNATSCDNNSTSSLPSSGFYDIFIQTGSDHVDFVMVCHNQYGPSQPMYARVTVNHPCTDGAEFVTEQAPDVMPVNWSFTGNVTMRNTGNCTWPGSGEYALRSVNSNWGTMSVPLSVDIPPGGQVSFAIQAAAPGVSAGYNFQWVMAHGGFTFGGSSPAFWVEVITNPYVFSELKKQDPSETITFSNGGVSVDKKTGATCYFIDNYHEGWVPASYVTRIPAIRVSQNLTWCVKKGRFACGQASWGVYACPFYRDIAHDQHFNWGFKGYDYGLCSTNNCSDAKQYVNGTIPVNVYIKGDFEDCLHIPLVGSIYCTSASMKTGDRVYPDGRHVHTY